MDTDDSELGQIAFKYGTDKCPQIRHHYTPVYYELFKDRRDSVRKVLEIGVGNTENMPYTPHYVTGASLYMWREFFPNAQIYGADILPELVLKDDRIETFLCDQSKKADLENLIKKTGSDIDLVIDDGSHKASHQVFSCMTLMPLLKKDVVYAIEDIDRTYIIDELRQKYDVHYQRFRHKSDWGDRLIIVRNL